ncbi:MAG: Holliday junction branch migration protein RuvA [Acholeplasmataceae bacterium]
MYGYIQGKIKSIKPSYIILENNGIGYQIIAPNPYVYHYDEEVTVQTYLHVREDVHALYGFRTAESKDLFLRLLGVSGIGPKSALSLLATDAISDIIVAIEEGNVKFLTRFPGIGVKSAQQIILDLKGKLVDADDELVPTMQNDVADALGALGYSKTEIKKVMKKIKPDQPVELMIKEALQYLLK